MIARRDRFTPTGGQQATRDALRDALRAPAAAPALLLVTGEPGSGKSAMLADLLAGIEDDPDLAVGAISAAAHPDGRFLRTMIAAFDEAPVGRSGIELLTTLRAIFAARAAAGRRPVLLIDGAEALTGSQLEIVRSLLNPVGDGPATLPPMIALIGRPELRERIRRRRPLARRRAHDLQLTVPDRDDIARVTGGTIQQADVLITKANQRGIAPLTLAALVIERTGGAPADDASVRSVLHALPAGEPAELSVKDVVQTTLCPSPPPMDGEPTASRSSRYFSTPATMPASTRVEVTGDAPIPREPATRPLDVSCDRARPAATGSGQTSLRIVDRGGRSTVRTGAGTDGDGASIA